MEKLQKWNSRLEKFWLVISIVATITSLIIAIVDKFNGVGTYFLLTALCWGIYLIRRGLRKRFEKNS